jgi:Mn2+/Fe2+ NRAMP family transporter
MKGVKSLLLLALIACLVQTVLIEGNANTVNNEAKGKVKADENCCLTYLNAIIGNDAGALVFKAPGLFSATCRKVVITTKSQNVLVQVDAECLEKAFPPTFAQSSITVPNMSLKLGSWVCA